jgi:hypothetical protein
MAVLVLLTGVGMGSVVVGAGGLVFSWWGGLAELGSARGGPVDLFYLQFFLARRF